MHYIVLLIFVLLVFACNKAEQSKVTQSLPSFSCNDTSDDGKFELWDTTVQNLIFKHNPNIRNPDSVVPGYLIYSDSASQTLSLTQPEFCYRAIYDTGIWWYTVFGIVDNVSGQVEGWGNANRSNGYTNGIVTEKISFSAGSGLTAGCKRIYYYAYKQDSFYKSQMTYIIPGKVLFKGHYDVYVN